MVVDIPDVITSANFGEDRLRSLGVAGGQNLPFSIDFDRRPYNTLALVCDGPKIGGTVPFRDGELDPHLTQCGQG